MDKRKKLLELRQKKNAAKKQESDQKHQELLDAVKDLHSLFDKSEQKTNELLKELAKFGSFEKQVQKIQKAIEQIPNDVTVNNIEDLIKVQKDVDLSEVTEAIQDLTESVKNQTVESVKVSNQDPEDFIATRRVRKVKGRLVYDDDPLKVQVVGGGTRVVNNYSKEEAKDVLFDPHEQAPDYIGTHSIVGADTSNTNWYISKFTRDGSGRATRIQRRKGSWDDRAIGW